MPLGPISYSDLCASPNAAGAGVIEYAPVDEIDASTWEYAVNSAYNQQRAVLATTWYQLPYTPESGRWTEDQSDDEQGVHFQTNVSARIAGDTAAVRKTLHDMRTRRFVLRVKRNGVTILIGSPEYPLRFVSRFDSGASAGDDRVHNVSWTGKTLIKSPAYTPVF